MLGRVAGLVALAPLLGCAMLYVGHEQFNIHVVNRSFEQVRIYALRGNANPVPLGTVRPDESRSVRAFCSDFQGRITDFVIRGLARTSGHWVRGEMVGSCSDSLVIEIPQSGPRFTTVEVWW